MDVFEFREQLISEYEGFSRSFTRIRAEDILTHVDEQYEQGRFWHPPLIQLNPNFVIGGQIDSNYFCFCLKSFKQNSNHIYG